MNKNSSTNQQRLALIKPFIGRMTLGFVVMLVTIAIQLSFPKALAYFIDNVVGQQDRHWLSDISVTMLIVFVIYCGATALRYYLFESTGMMIVNKIRRILYGAIVRQEIGFFDAHKVGELISRLSSDVEVLKDTLSMSLAISLRSVFVFIGALFMLLTLSVELSLLMLFVIPVSLLLGRWLGGKARTQSKALQQSTAYSMEMAQESLSNIRLVHSFNRQQTANQNYKTAIDNMLEKALGNTRLFAIFSGASTFITYSFILATLWLGGQLVADQSMTIGALTSFILYAGMLSGAASAITSFWGDWMRSYGATERVFEFINRIPNLPERADCVENANISGKITFSQVSFAYPQRPEQTVLKGFNLTINVGEKVAIVGPSGAGKTTIANLLLGFYQPSSGELSFDGINSTQLKIESIRDAIAIVEQEPALFSGSIAENIEYAVNSNINHGDVDREDIESAAKQANAHDFIIQFPEGYQTIVGERGAQLSGGQKQRIAIARALLRDPKILILDEATSALDSESENLVQQALCRLMTGRTTIMIAHRYSTIAKADKLVVLDKGEIIQSGDHKQLYSDESSLYHRLMVNQIQTSSDENLI